MGKRRLGPRTGVGESSEPLLLLDGVQGAKRALSLPPVPNTLFQDEGRSDWQWRSLARRHRWWQSLTVPA